MWQKFAHPDKVQIIRENNTIEVKLKDFLSGNDLSQNIVLRPGDIIQIPHNDYAKSKGYDSREFNDHQVIVYGFVNKVAGGNAFQYFPGYTARDYIALAGGTKEQNSSFGAGNLNRVRIYRADGKKIVNAINEVVLPGDIIEVPSSILYQIVGSDGILRTLGSVISSAYLIYRYVEDQNK